MIDEKILVVANKELFPEDKHKGFFQVDLAPYNDLISKKGTFMWRQLAEQNTNYKQIIPYLIFVYNQKIFLMQRRATASEIRLKNKFCIGIGGHIRQEDLDLGKSIIQWADREFHEEVMYNDPFAVEPVGIINQDITFVDRVHAGFVYIIHGSTDAITIRDEHKSGKLVSLEECKRYYDRLEGWSQIVLDYLEQRFAQENSTRAFASKPTSAEGVFLQ